MTRGNGAVLINRASGDRLCGGTFPWRGIPILSVPMLPPTRFRLFAALLVAGMLSALEVLAGEEISEKGGSVPALWNRNSEWRNALRMEYVFSPDRTLPFFPERVVFKRSSQATPGGDRSENFVIVANTLNVHRLEQAVQSHASSVQVNPSDEPESLSQELRSSFGLPPGSETSEEGDPQVDIQRMPAFVVKDRTMEFYKLKLELTLQETRARETEKMNRVNSALGNRVYGVQTKHFAAGVVTVFYIPVYAGFGFSW